MSTTKSRRFEARLDAETDDLIAEAAELLHVSKSAFVTAAAAQEAQRVVARAETTFISAEVFDSMLITLDIADEAPGLAEAARLPRLSTR